MYSQNKVNLIQIHEKCKALGIAYFALDDLARSAEKKLPIPADAPWKIGMRRADYDLFCQEQVDRGKIQIVVYEDLGNDMIAPENGIAFNKNLLYPIKNRHFDDTLILSLIHI